MKTAITYSKIFYSEGGIVEFVEMLDSNGRRIHLFQKHYMLKGMMKQPMYAVEVALTYNDGYNEHIYSYVNNINTIEGGTHVAGFRTSINKGV